jgi:hypothetical protein
MENSIKNVAAIQRSILNVMASVFIVVFLYVINLQIELMATAVEKQWSSI